MKTKIKNTLLGNFSRLKYVMFPVTIACVLLLILTGFNSPNATKIVDEPTTHTVTIFQMKFDPANLKVKKGDKVVWINKDIVPHDVTEEINKTWTSKPLQKGEKWSKVITEDVKYFCSLHQVMKGTITVTK